MSTSADQVRSLSPTAGMRLVLLISVLIALQWSVAQPSARFYVNSVYVPSVGKVLVFGGIIEGDGSSSAPVHPEDLVWWWDPSDGSWTQGDLGDSNVPAVSQLAVHEPTGHVMVYGTHGFATLGETWFFDPLSNSWERVDLRMINTPTTGLGPGLAYYPPTDSFVMYGNASGALSSP